MSKEKTLNSMTLLAKAYAFAKAGKAKIAGKLLVEASEDDGLEEVMDGIAQGAEELEAADDWNDVEDDGEDDGEDTGGDDGDDGDDEDDEDEGDDDEAVVEANVKLPASVARLAARTQV